LGTLAFVEWALGRADEARRRVREALGAAQRRNTGNDIAQAECFALVLDVLLREPVAALARGDHVIGLAEEHHLSGLEAAGRVLRGWAAANTGRHEEGIADIRRGLALDQAIGQRRSYGFFLGLLAEAHAQAGALVDALAVIEDALVAVGGEDFDKTDLLRIRGDLLARQGGEPRHVEASYRDAIDLARRQAAKMPELRAATSLGRWFTSRGQGTDARGVLAPILASFSEGFDTRDLREASELLERLG
jgi:adenylate cyclase